MVRPSTTSQVFSSPLKKQKMNFIKTWLLSTWIYEALFHKKRFCFNMFSWSAEIFKRATLILKDYSFAWNMPLNPLAPNALFWILLNLSLQASEMQEFFA